MKQENIRNQNEIGENEVLVLSFGTRFHESRILTIGGIEEAIENALPKEWAVRRGFTSPTIIKRIEKLEGIRIDSLREALERAVANGVKNLVVQPTHLMNGRDYEEATGILAEYAGAFQTITAGAPLLASGEDFAFVANALIEVSRKYEDGKTAMCFMGHGTDAESNQVYRNLQELLREKDMVHYYIGTVGAFPALDTVLKAVQAGSYQRVVLRPLMVVAGDHANNDMAGDHEGSWKRAFETAGYEVEAVLEGLGQIPAIQEIYAAHARAAINRINGEGDVL